MIAKTTGAAAALQSAARPGNASPDDYASSRAVLPDAVSFG